MQKASRDIRFESNYSGSQFWFLQWLSLANTVLPTEIIICRFADEWGGGVPPPTPPCSAAPGWKRSRVFPSKHAEYPSHYPPIYATARRYLNINNQTLSYYLHECTVTHDGAVIHTLFIYFKIDKNT